ncbi:MAG: hypothetical protein M9933_12425 [Chitinophagaceae bacterium]|nr:hypothetical protein [Chitinophagaceae bacterium]
MFHILHQYLIQNKSLSLPGLGTIALQYIPAISNFTDHVIEPPMQKVIFDDLNDAPDKTLFQYVSSKLQVEEWEAIKKVNDFSFELKNRLKQEGEIIWDRVGKLHANVGGSITLEAKTITYDFMEPALARRIIRTDANHSILIGDTEISGRFIQQEEDPQDADPFAGGGSAGRDKWWIWACILGGIALLVLILHFYQSGPDLYHLQNIQKNPVKEAPATYQMLNR